MSGVWGVLVGVGRARAGEMKLSSPGLTTIPARAPIARENRWSMNVRSGLMSRMRMPCMQSLRIMSSRSIPARVVSSGMHSPDA